MSAMSPVPKDHPLMLAWEAHKKTEEYANSRNWAAHPQHVDGSLWALFSAGWQAAQPAQSVDVWQPIETAPKAKSVLVAYVNECGKSRVVRACFIARFTELSDEDTNNEINPADENCYTIEGWYEQIDNWDEYSGIRIHHEVTHWTPLPGAPTLTAALQEPDRG